MYINHNEIKNINLSHLQPYITDLGHQGNINAPAGQHHYKLLAWLSLQTTGFIVELGTHIGTSALALSINPNIEIVTFDIKDIWSASIVPNNVIRRGGDIFELGEQGLLSGAEWIFVDIDHRGVQEKKIHDFLIDRSYQGFVIYDDIHYNSAMREFWAGIKNKKEDITDVGHGYSPHTDKSGTGIVYYAD